MPTSTLKEGAIRRVLGTERQDFRDHLLRLSPNNRHSRFGGGVSDTFIAQHAEHLFDGNAIVYGWTVDGAIHAAAELHPIGNALNGTAEAAFSVEEAWQDTGVGTALLGRIMRAARNRGRSRLIMACLPENARMRRLAQKHGARLQWQDGDVLGLINPPILTPLSLWREAIEEGDGLLTALFKVPKAEAVR